MNRDKSRVCFEASYNNGKAQRPRAKATSKVLENYSDKVSVIPIGLDKTTYAKAEASHVQFWREKLGEKFFLFVGVLRYYKGLHILLDAIAGLDYPVVIAGSGPIENQLFEHAQRLNLKNIHFINRVSDEDKVALFTLCYGVIFPSHLRSEAFGISLLEGAMFGKPMISSEIGTGTTFINIDRETGLVVPPADSNSLREAMQYLWENPSTAQLMGKKAADRYRELFGAEKMVSSFTKLYSDLAPPHK